MRKSAGTLAPLFMLYLLLATACIALGRLPDSIAVIWLANAAAIGIGLRDATARSPQGLLVFALAIFVANVLIGADIPTSLGLAGANLLEVLIALVPLLRLRRWNGEELTVAHTTLALAMSGFVAPVFGASIGSAILSMIENAPTRSLWWLWAVGSALGAMMIIPLAITTTRDQLTISSSARHAFRLLALAALAVAVVQLSMAYFPYPFVIMGLPVMLAAALLDPFRTALIGSVVIMTVVFQNIGHHANPGTTAMLVSINASTALAVVPSFLLSILKDALSRSQKRAKAGERQFRTAMQNSAIGMALVDISGRLVEVNKQFADFIGYSPEEAVKISFQEITHPDDLTADVQLLQRVLAGEIDHYEIEKRYIRKDGRVVWALLAVSLIRAEATGKPDFFISQVVDIDDRKRFETRLADSESRWSFALESAGQGVWDRDIETDKTYYSPLWKRMLGYEPEEQFDNALFWASLIHPDDLERIMRLDEECTSGRRDAFSAEFRMKHRDGRWIWIADRGRVLGRNAQGRPQRMIGTHTDITELKQSEDALRVLNERIRLAVDAGAIGVWDIELSTDFVTWDARMCHMYGIEPGAFTGSRLQWRSFLHPDDCDATVSAFRETLRTGKRFDTEFRTLGPSGDIRYLHVLAQALTREDGTVDRVVGVQWDITDQRRLTQQLFDEKERLRITLYSIGDAVITTDRWRRITFMNPIAERLTGWTRAEADGRPLEEVFRLIDEASGQPIPNPVEECLKRGQTFHLQDGAALIARDGAQISIQDSAAPVRGVDGIIHGAVLVFQDVTQTRTLQRELTHSALHDALTDLPNRRSFELSLTAACDGAGEKNQRHVLGFLDLDRFKFINDTAGHAAGDAALRVISRLLQSSLRENDVVARLGGDEFGLILHGCGLTEAQGICDQIVRRIRELAFQWNGRTYDLGASIGISEISGARRDPAVVMKEADVACYTAKSSGRDRVALYQVDSGDAVRRLHDIDIASRLRDAIANGRFCVYAQRIHPLSSAGATQKIIEAFIRLRDDGQGLLSPAAFIPAAERYDLMNSIDRWMISTILGRYGSRLRLDPSTAISINLSANSLDDDTLWAFVEEQLAASNVHPSQIYFEITETALMRNIAAAISFVGKAQTHGVGIALDDFGVGLSSFAYLKNLRVDIIKIDGSFSRDAVGDERDRQIIRAIVDLARSLNIPTVAEGIETEDALSVVKKAGVCMAQGYYWGQPCPIEDLLPLPEGVVGRDV